MRIIADTGSRPVPPRRVLLSLGPPTSGTIAVPGAEPEAAGVSGSPSAAGPADAPPDGRPVVTRGRCAAPW